MFNDSFNHTADNVDRASLHLWNLSISKEILDGYLNKTLFKTFRWSEIKEHNKSVRFIVCFVFINIPILFNKNFCTAKIRLYKENGMKSCPLAPSDFTKASILNKKNIF